MVTLEDVVEEILQDKIADGTDSVEAHRERKSCADRITLDYGTITSTWLHMDDLTTLPLMLQV